MFARTKEANGIAYTKVAEIKNSTKSVEEQCRSWLPKKKPESDFATSPADIKEHRKVDIRQGQCGEKGKEKLNTILQNFDIISKSSRDIGTTPLSMDIDTGDSPPVSQRPYTLPLKHHAVINLATCPLAMVTESSIGRLVFCTYWSNWQVGFFSG